MTKKRSIFEKRNCRTENIGKVCFYNLLGDNDVKNISSLAPASPQLRQIFFKKRTLKDLASYLVEMFEGKHDLSNIDPHLVLCETLSLRKMSKKFSTIYII